MLWEILLGGLIAAVLAALGCLLWRRLLLPLGTADAILVLPARGGGEDLEQRLQACGLLRRWGLLDSAPVILDLDLNDEGRALAERLTDAFEAELCSPEELRLLL